MKKVFTILAVASLVSFAACNNAAKEDENNAIVEEFAFEEAEEVEEAPVEIPSK